jgi:hypothetical protein
MSNLTSVRTLTSTTAALTSVNDARQFVTHLLNDPVAFSSYALKHSLWHGQKEILHAIAKHKRVAVKACHSSGKTFVAADALLWWITRYPDGIAISSAPTWTQVAKVMWDYVHKAVGTSKISYGEINQTEIRLAPGNFAIGLSTDQGIRFQGYKGRILLILDEAPGIKPDIWEAIEGMAAGGDVHILALGNPTVASGPFYDAFHKNRESWHTMTISAFDTPNLVPLEQLLTMTDRDLDIEVCRGLVSRRWVKEKYREYGPGHYFWDSRILGEFPQNQADALITNEMLERAKELRHEDNTETHVGIDVAGQGRDQTVVVVREGMAIVEVASWNKDDARGDVLALLKNYPNVRSVNVDSVGIGYNFALHLRDQGYPVKLINVGEAARDKDRFRNLKAELFWRLRMRFVDGDICGVNHERLVSELRRLRYGFNEKGQMVMESKDEIRKSDGYSPDAADAAMLCFAYEPSKIRHDDREDKYRLKPLTAGLLSKKL